MSERVQHAVMGALMTLLVINLVLPVVFHFSKPNSAQAAVSATYKEYWTANTFLITQPAVGRAGCQNWYGYSTYQQRTRGNLGSYYAGYAYKYNYSNSCNYSWTIAPHGIVTNWTVAGTLNK